MALEKEKIFKFLRLYNIVYTWSSSGSTSIAKYSLECPKPCDHQAVLSREESGGKAWGSSWGLWAGKCLICCSNDTLYILLH